MTAAERHAALDELLAAFLDAPENRGKVPSRTPIMELIQWSHGQVENRKSGGSIPAEMRTAFELSGKIRDLAALEPPPLNKSGGSVTWEETGDTIAPCCFLFPLATPPGGTWTCPECGASWRRDQDRDDMVGTVRRVNEAGGSKAAT